MRLYLVQHGKATTKEEDPLRPLTEEGITDVQRAGERLAASGELVLSRVVHSGKTRAEETAGLLANEAGRMGDAPEIVESDALGPTDDPSIWAARLADAEADIGDGGLMLVGHLPWMERMAGLMVCGDAEATAVSFSKGGVLCLEHDDGVVEPGGWAVRWYLTPALVGPAT